MTLLLGEQNGQAKLTRDQVLQIYEMAWSGHYTQAEIAKVFWISRETVSYIKLHKNWKWLTQNQRMKEN
jgi:DNA invertase Pin-like site-specific DNA recombinase